MNIRQVSPDDAPNLAALSTLVFLHTYAQEGLRDKISHYVLSHLTPEYFQNICRSVVHHLYVAIAEQHLIGFILLDTDSTSPDGKLYDYEIVTLYVHPHFQGRGVGRMLVEYAVRQQGNKFWLKTWVHNSKAINFYHHLGLLKAGETFFDLDGEQHKNYIFVN